MQRTPTAPDAGFWADDEVEFSAYCLYGGDAAIRLAASRLDELRPGYDYFAVDDVRLRRTIPRAADAMARELLNLGGAVGPAMPWGQGLDRLGHLTGEGCCTEAWVRIRGGVVVEIAVIMEGGLNYSLPRPRGAQCADNGLDVNPLLMVVDSVPAASPTGELSLHVGPGLSTEINGTVPVGTLLNVIHRCEIVADGFGWWMLDWDGRFVWGPGEFLRQYSRG